MNWREMLGERWRPVVGGWGLSVDSAVGIFAEAVGREIGRSDQREARG